MSRGCAWAFVWRRIDENGVRLTWHDTRRRAERDQRRLAAARSELRVIVGPVVKVPLLVWAASPGDPALRSDGR